MTFLPFPSAPILYKFSLLVSLMLLIGLSWNAPMSGDEYVHVAQAEKNIDYLRSYGHDKEALDTPISRLKHYGQSFDTLTTFVAQIFSIKDLYRFRHVSNAVIAWLVILFASATTVHLTKSQTAGLITVVLMLATGRFMGHAMNNLKDIPFAFSFIFSIYFVFRFLERLPTISWKNVAFIILGIAFGISIRIGGLLIFAYFLLFTFLWVYFIFQRGEIRKEALARLLLSLFGVALLIIGFSYFLGIMAWPWALEAPVAHPIKSLLLMGDYPTTVRQIFEGRLYWSDQFPWYYLFKYLLITLPVVVILGFFAYLIFRLRDPDALVKSFFLVIAFGFPLFYASATGANVYGGWRQMLFVFPPLVVLSAIGIWNVFLRTKKWKAYGVAIILFFSVLVAYPFYFIFRNYPYQYMYFNVLAGGVKGAYGNYELDYYFMSFQKAYEFIDSNVGERPVVVAANFVIPEYYAMKSYKPLLLDYYNRSAVDWDYAVICNTFLDPQQLKNGLWPPENTIYSVEVEGRQILAILGRESKNDLAGVELLKKGDYKKAIAQLGMALDEDRNNESILINLARAYFFDRDLTGATQVLERLEEVYPNNEWATDLRGEMLMEQGEYEKAITLFSRNIGYNYKFFHSYVNLANAYLALNQQDKAIAQLQACLRINPFYGPAYKVYGKILIEKGDVELGNKMLKFTVKGNSKYGKN
jgi:tetratricopeptide (TPR) repeat protein